LVNENRKLENDIYQMRAPTLIFGQPHTKDCVMKLSGGMAQIPLHAKFSACP